MMESDSCALSPGTMRCRFIAFFTLMLYFTGSALAGIVTGNVTGVLDGDTIEVLSRHHADRIRLSGIDCPEKGQAFGKKAKQAASALVFGKEVTLQTHGHDKYKRTLAYVFLLDGTNVNHALVKDGWCWWYRKYAPGDTVLQRLEMEAREAQRGLWADPQPLPPWEWRKRSKGGYRRAGMVDHATATVASLLLPPACSHQIQFPCRIGEPGKPYLTLSPTEDYAEGSTRRCLCHSSFFYSFSFHV